MCSPVATRASSPASSISSADLAPTAPDACVIIGRGKKIQAHPGNRRFQSIVQSHLDKYSSAPTKSKKSQIILDILAEVQSQDGANFCKLDPLTSTYVTVEETAARVTVAQALRDALNDTYKSSKQHKQRRRLAIKKECIRQARRLYPQQMMIGANSSSSSSSSNNENNMMVLNQNVASVTQSVGMAYLQSQEQQGQEAWKQLSYPRMVTPINSSATMNLNDILQEAVDLTSLQSVDCISSSANFMMHHDDSYYCGQQLQQSALPLQDEPPAAPEEADVFASLFRAFAPADVTSSSMVDLEPTPILEEQDVWEPLPLSE